MDTFTGTYSRRGNPKVGTHVSIVNREAGATCPGASPWCEACYAMHGNFKRFNLQARYAAADLVLPDNPRDLMRWHVSGDFDSIAYIEFCIDYMRAHTKTQFWAYTRSWNVAELLPALEIMRALPNMQLFASVDPTMPEPPPGWRIAYLPEVDDRYTGMVCLEQVCSSKCPPDCNRQERQGHVAKMPDCERCQYCFAKPKGNVGFLLHATK